MTPFFLQEDRFALTKTAVNTDEKPALNHTSSEQGSNLVVRVGQEPTTLQQALEIAFKAESYGLTDQKDQVLTQLGVGDFFDELDFMESARQQGNLFYAYFGNHASSSLKKYPQIQKCLTRLVYAGMEIEVAQKKVNRKIKRRTPGLLFDSRLRTQLAKEANALIKSNPFFNSDKTLANETVYQAALFRINKRLGDDHELQESVNASTIDAQNQVLRLVTLATKGYRIKPKHIQRVRVKMWKGGLFSKGLRARPEGNLLMMLFNTYCGGVGDFLMVMHARGKLHRAQKLIKNGIEDDANYLKAAAIFLKHGDTERAKSLQADLYSRRPVYLPSGVCVDKSSVAAAIGNMISNFEKWEMRVRRKHTRFDRLPDI